MMLCMTGHQTVGLVPEVIPLVYRIQEPLMMCRLALALLYGIQIASLGISCLDVQRCRKMQRF